jgi:hypothetical protein
MITGNNLTTTRLHVSCYVEEKMIAHPMRQQIARFGRHLRHLNGAKIPKHSLLITQNTCVKISKYPQRQNFFFLSFIRLKMCFHCTWIMKKP